MVAMKTCRTCGETKPLSAFQPRLGVTANARESHLRSCIECNRHRLRQGQNQYTVERLPRGFWRGDEPARDRAPVSRSEWKARLRSRAGARHG